MRRIKHLGLAVLAAAALTTLLGAGTASATQFRAEEYPITLNGTQGTQQKIKVASGTVQCTTSTMTGTLSASSSSATLTPSLKGCTAFGLSATPVVNSCSYVLNSTNESAPLTGTMSIACSKGGDAIEFKALGVPCTLRIPAQTGLQIGLANSEFIVRSRNRHITETLSASGIKYTLTGGACPIVGSGSFEDGTLTGTSIIKGSNAGHAVGVYLANEQVDAPPLFSDEAWGGSVTSDSATMTMSFEPGTIKCTAFQVGSPTLQSVDGKLSLNVQQWSGCYFGGALSVNANGCGLVFQATTSEGENAWGTLGIGCPLGSSITFTALGCTVSIPAQTNKVKMEFKTVGTGKERKIATNMAVGGLSYTSKGGICSGGSHQNGSLIWNSNLKSSIGGLFVVS